MIRSPAVEGAFYPADRSTLDEDVSGYIRNSGISSDPCTAGIVSPHAGYVYSGPIAGCAFASAPDEVDTVIILAPSHGYPLYGASVYSGEGFRTPLGDCETDTRLVEKLLELDVGSDQAAHAREHSAEVQVPFVQVTWPDAKIVVIVQGLTSSSFSMEMAGKISKASGDSGILLVASSDLSHYHTLAEAAVLDERGLNGFQSGDATRLGEILGSREGEACGGGPVQTLLCWSALKGYSRFEKLAYDTSATASGDTRAVVGYFAGAVKRDG